MKHSLRKNPSSPLLALLGASVLAFHAARPSCSAASLLTDDFASTTITGTGASQTVTTGAATYKQINSASVYGNTSAGALSISSVGNAIGYTQFSSITLANTGDYISLSFDVAYPSGATSTISGFRFGLYNTSGDINTAGSYNATTNTVGDSAKGYFLTLNPGDTSTGGVSKDLGNQTLTGGNAVLSNGSGSGGSALGANFTRTTALTSTLQTITLTLTKTAAGLTLSGAIAGDAFSVNDLSSSYSTYDTFFFGNGGASGVWQMDNLSLTTNAVPEPRAGLLLGMALMTVIIFRRRAGFLCR